MADRLFFLHQRDGSGVDTGGSADRYLRGDRNSVCHLLVAVKGVSLMAIVPLGVVVGLNSLGICSPWLKYSVWQGMVGVEGR